MTEDELNPQVYLRELARQFDQAERVGALEDVPEGARTVRITDTLAREIAERLRRIAESL
jgi:hypothetical protein